MYSYSAEKKKSFIELGIPNSKKFLYLDMKKGNQDGLLKSYVQAHFFSFSKWPHQKLLEIEYYLLVLTWLDLVKIADKS